MASVILFLALSPFWSHNAVFSLLPAAAALQQVSSIDGHNLGLDIPGDDSIVPDVLNRTELKARAGSPMYDAADLYGHGLMCRLTPNQIVPPARTWAFADLARYGWSYLTGPNFGTFPTDIDDCLHAIDVPIGRGPNMYVNMEHNEYWTTDNGQHGNPSGGYYRGWVNPKDKIIIGTEANAPSRVPGARPPYPPLSRLSDMFWLTWARECELAGTHPGDMDFILHYWVVNLATVPVVNEVLQRLGQTLKPWPGVEVKVGTSEGDALLGTGTGRMVGFMLSDNRHNGQVNKRPRTVTIFQSVGVGRGALNLLFELEDIE